MVLVVDGYKPYSEVFSPEKHAESIKNNSFAIVARPAAEKCDGKSPWLQKGSRCSYVNEGELSQIVSQRSYLTAEQVDHFKTIQGIVDLNKKGISLALEKRVALFFQQSILCYNMSGFVFSARGADCQIGSSPGLKFSSGGNNFTIHKREAAHSSTIPTLIAEAKDGSTPGGFVYLKGGTSYYQHQATIGMHELVNGADELIDGNGNDGKLRKVAVDIINRVANGLDPKAATEEFCRKLDNEIDKNIDSLLQLDRRKAVLERYKRKITKIKNAMTDPILFDRLIGVIIDSNNPKEKILREVIYKKRYDVILLQEVVESRIARRIENVKNQMGAKERSFIEHILIKAFWEPSEKTVLEKLFGKTTAFFENDYPTSTALKSFNTRIENLQKKYSVQIDNLKRDLRADFSELRKAEFSYRSAVFKDLRTKVNKWTQEEFCQHYYNTTQDCISQAWVSRMENLSRVSKKATYETPIAQRRRFVSIVDAKNCAKTFGVDAGIFFPSLFTSVS